MGVTRVTKARDRVVAVTGVDLTSRAVIRECLAALHEVAEFRWAAVMAVDPDTILPVSAVIEGFSDTACAPFWEAELAGPGYLKFADLARRADPVGTLSEATDGDLRRSPSYVGMLEPVGAGDELRASFVLGSSCWGIASLVRDGADGFFTDGEVADVRQLVRLIARAMREVTVRGESLRTARTAFVVFDNENQPVHATAEARALIDGLSAVEYLSAAGDVGPGVLRALITQARYSITGRTVESRMRDASGTWFRVRAARTDADRGCVAVVIEPACASELLSMSMAAHGLTDREAQIVRYLARGLSTTDIAAELSLSPHTIRDHVKAILHKCGVCSRGELVATLFADQLGPALHRSLSGVELVL